MPTISLYNRPLRKLDNFAISSRNESLENRSLQDVNEDSKKMNDEEIIQKSQFPKRSNGILVQMFWNNHAPPLFHALYAEHETLIDSLQKRIFL